MIQTKAIAVLFLVGQILCESQSDKSQQSQIPDFDPQLLNYHLQQLAIQQYSNQAHQPQYDSQYAGQQQSQSSQIPQQDSQSVQYSSGQSQQQYETQSGQQQGLRAETHQLPQLTQQDYEAARLLQTKLFEPYQGQLSSVQPQSGQYSVSQSAQVAAQPSAQQLPKQRLLGVAYSSAADASKTSFTGYGIKYSF